MFKNRELTVKMGKTKDHEVNEDQEIKTFEEKAEAILRITEKVATKIFVGICAYVVLDTGRKVMIEKTKNNHQH